MTLIVAAIGGNAISPPEDAGLSAMRLRIATTATRLADLVDAGYKLVVTHGNGPQVGNLLLQNEEARHAVPAMPLDVCVAESQAQIGYLLQQALQNEFAARGSPRPVASLVTQSVVDANDPAFQEPAKPIGPTYESEQEVMIKRAKGWRMAKDPRGGWRRVVPSPRPLDIVEKDLIHALLRAGNSGVLIAAGGGGVPVVRRGTDLVGVEAVIDKDLAAAVLARDLAAERLVLVTDVERVALDFKKPGQRFLDHLTVAEAREYLKEGQFAAGSMGPKIEAAVEFILRGGKEAVIGGLTRLREALAGTSGTRITA